MSPKEKAVALVEKMMLYSFEKSGLDNEIVQYSVNYKVEKESAIQCVLIAIDEVIKELYPSDIKRCEYWNEIKIEIEKL